MITFPYIHIEGSVGKEFCQEHKLDSGSMIYKKTTAWHDGRYYKSIFQLFLNKEEYEKIYEGFGRVNWDIGIHFYGGYYIYINKQEQFDRAITYLGL